MASQILPLDCRTVADALSAGMLWVLPNTQNGHDPQQCGGSHLSVLMVTKSAEARGRCAASILAAHPSAVHSALLIVAQRLLARSPHFMPYIELGPGCAAPELYKAQSPVSWLVYGREL